MNATDYALASVERLKGYLLGRQAGKMVPNVLIERELALLTERVRAMGNQEPVVFNIDAYRRRNDECCCAGRCTCHEADEMPEPCSGVAEIEDGS